jgi:hypothetical protein
MRGLFIGAAIIVAILSGFALGDPALADGPGADERDALIQLALAGAPLVEETSENAAPADMGWNSSAASLRSSITPLPPGRRQYQHPRCRRLGPGQRCLSFPMSRC